MTLATDQIAIAAATDAGTRGKGLPCSDAQVLAERRDGVFRRTACSRSGGPKQSQLPLGRDLRQSELNGAADFVAPGPGEIREHWK